MKKKFSLTITHLYPKYMNIYGDIGNIIILAKRCEWRGIKVKLLERSLNETLPKQTDIYFMGGGQDRDQHKVFKDLNRKKELLSKQIGEDVCFLGICGAYQLLGKRFLTGALEEIKGLGILDIETKAPNSSIDSRCIGNLVCNLNTKIFNDSKMELSSLVGFENHSGQTFLGRGVQPLAYVQKGFGNNIQDDTEGVIYKNMIGTYMHGSFLPKNPHIADWLIAQALKRKYNKTIKLDILNDYEEIEAHQFIIDNY